MDSRTKNSKRNILTGLIQRTIGIILPFVNRTMILYFLGAEFQGLSSLFTSILSVLSLAELGLSSAIVFSMYQPLAEGDTSKVNALLKYFKNAYRIIGACILCCGILLIPILPELINSSLPKGINIYILYGVYLINTVISYFCFAYKSTILVATQRSDITHNILSVVKIIECVFQFVVLILFQNYYAYVIILPICSVINNVGVAIVIHKMYPEYDKPHGKIDDETKKALRQQVQGLVICKVGDTFRNSFDSIIISSMFGLTMVAIYSNYYYVFSSLYMILCIIVNSMGASVGNSIVKDNENKNFEDYRKFNFLYSWLTGWCTVCMLCLYQPFMRLWVGNSLMLSDFDMVLFCVYFYILNANNIRNLYLNGKGLWWELKYQYIFEAVGNLILNFLLGYFWGISGILMATIITIFLFNFLSRTIVLFKYYFVNESVESIFTEYGLYLVATILVSLVSYFACSLVSGLGIFIDLVLRSVICLIVPNLMYYIIFRRYKLCISSIKWAKKSVLSRN